MEEPQAVTDDEVIITWTRASKAAPTSIDLSDHDLTPIETLQELARLHLGGNRVTFDNRVLQDCTHWDGRGWDRVDALLDFATTTNRIQGVVLFIEMGSCHCLSLLSVLT